MFAWARSKDLKKLLGDDEDDLDYTPRDAASDSGSSEAEESEAASGSERATPVPDPMPLGLSGHQRRLPRSDSQPLRRSLRTTPKRVRFGFEDDMYKGDPFEDVADDPDVAEALADGAADFDDGLADEKTGAEGFSDMDVDETLPVAVRDFKEWPDMES